MRLSGSIHYFDVHVVNMAGEAETIENAVCMHEEDYGTLWKHTDWHSNHCEVRRSRRPVISFFETVGNYHYGFFSHPYQNGEIQVEIKLTGYLSVGHPRGAQPTHGVLVALQLYAPIHQHYFNFRLDLWLNFIDRSRHEHPGWKLTIARPKPSQRANPRSVPNRLFPRKVFV